MYDTIAHAPTVNDTCNVLAVTIVAQPGRSELAVTVDHSPEATRNEDGETRTVTSRTFRRRVACPVAAAQAMARETYIRHPTAIVTLVNA